MGDRAQREAWVTLATNDAYALGCLVLANSLRRVGTTRQLVVMVTDGVSQGMRYQLENVFNRVVDVSLMDSEDERNLALLGRPDLNVTFTKIHCWELTEYEKGVFLDADTLVLQNCDDLFDREELSAAPDAGWPDCFNSGVFVFRPSLETYQSILDFALSLGSFDGGDQGLLNSYFNTWSTKDISKHLPFLYNVVSQAFYSYLPAFEKFRSEIKIVHFIGPVKPWNHPYNTATRTVSVFPETGHWQEFLQLWWDIFMDLVQPCLDPTMGGLVGELAQMKVGGGEGADRIILDDRERRLAWERGHADYLGVDSFDNIQKKLDEKMAPVPVPVPVNNREGSAKKSEGSHQSQSETSLTKPVEVNDVEGRDKIGSDSIAPPSEVVVASVPQPAPVELPVVEEVKPTLPSPVAEPEAVAPSPASAPVSSWQPISVAEELPQPAPSESAEPLSVVAEPVAVPACVPVVAPEPAPVVSASISLGGGGVSSEEVTETITLGDASPATFATPAPAPAAEASISLPGPPAAAAPQSSAEEDSSFTLSLSSPPEPAPVAEVAAAVVTPPTLAAKSPPVPEKKAVPPKPQEKLTPLQIGKKPPPPTPQKPMSAPAAVEPKSPPPPVPEKPTSPVAPSSGITSPLVPAKPTSPAAMGISAQRSMFEKPAPAAAKPTPRVGGSISAFAARFQQPPAQTPASKPTPGVVPKPTSPTSPGVAPKPTSPTSAGVVPTSPGASASSSSPTSGSTSKNSEFLARYGLKKK